MAGPIRVTVWNEFRHETSNADIARIYPNGMHAAIACHLETRGFAVKTATLDEPQHGLTEDVLSETDVLTWWGHAAHREVEDEIVERVQRRVLDGMGLIVLHSGHFSKIFKKLMGTTCNLKWREIAEHERIWVVEPGHPIAQGLPPYFELDHVEMYGERFDIPAPDQLVLLSWFPGGEVFRSGCCFNRGSGKIFYFRPGHETFPLFHNEHVLRVITNAVRWAAPAGGPPVEFGNLQPLEDIKIRP